MELICSTWCRTARLTKLRWRPAATANYSEPGGGYILSPAHLFQPDVPPENILAVYRAHNSELSAAMESRQFHGGSFPSLNRGGK
jgi:hypothetical protein